ncbi:MAG: hypothetical protein A3C06_01700 [Candidatus Taylorbacteria bacterium RIFCSPHIGHO2_02_FULL_46_13]|uniref:M23ase beta-sheet core domain-containing protein n=1 Tax=Candidatus Taylorbacteria bacterium RIFCSPHIGHO2_02_FULL_46_13 TaxID=1802312 RepID=A0A1G2MRA8_9BACT|nr:MAG: hypothetical protein A3C06_01700 [Candidatus Taylorbacteria bacterium RIFCSPHIGHO2_02_FULL_46_13]
MKNLLIKSVFSIAVLLSLPSIVWAASTVSLVVSPTEVMQGEPVIITIEGTNTLSSIKNISFNGTPLKIFLYQNKPTALLGIDLRQTPGMYKITGKLSDGSILEKILVVDRREKIELPLGIPEKLGGNTPTSQTTLISTLATENAILASLRTGTHAFWREKFRFPLSATTTITDRYGYFRQTGAYTIAHKGTDFRAAEGTNVFAMNRGVVRLAREFRNYGKTIVVDHGLGLMTFYMHLSRIKVNVGELVLPGQLIALSGQTGYAEKPHLHLTVRIGGISIDPIKFTDFFK